jgi:hypothetical protein
VAAFHRHQRRLLPQQSGLSAAAPGVYDVAFLFHILGVLSLISGVTVAGIAFEAARRRDSPAEIALLLGLTRAGVPLVGIGAVLAGGFGLWLVHLGRWGYSSAWVDASIALYIVALALGGRGGERPKQARELATRLAKKTPSDATPPGQTPSANQELRALLDDRASRAQNYISLLLMLVIVGLMCFKP